MTDNKAWAIPGQEQQTISKQQPTEQHVLMTSMRPDGKYKAADDGTWVQREATEQEAKLEGVEFDGVMCSATKDDQFGLTGYVEYIRRGLQLPPFEFANGNTLQITQANVDAFEAVWLPFRASFF